MADLHAFDATAAAYDEDFTHTRLGRWLRDEVHAELRPHITAGSRILELGGGTGEDAVTYAGWGARVTVVDASASMLEVARQKRDAAPPPVRERVILLHGDLDAPLPPEVGTGAPYDLIVANFGVINCVRRRDRLFVRLAPLIADTGRMALVPMSPWCPWEITWHLARGRPRDAFRRLRRRARAHVGGGGTIEVTYPGMRRLARDAAPAFRLVRTVGIGALLPPTYLSPLVDRHPGLYDRIRAIEVRVHGRPGFRSWNDHTLAWFERAKAATRP
jgi:SAM-dependent methyltransferase